MKAKLSKTNKLWNDLRLNSPWSLGFVSKLIGEKRFKDVDDWANFYFQSGEERLEKIKKLPLKYKVILLDPLSNDFFKLPSHIRELNFNYGRTLKELHKVAFIFYGAILSNNILNNPTITDAINMVYQRVLIDTYQGIVLRETNTIKTLKSHFPSLYFKELSGLEDTSYSVDYEVYFDNHLLVGLQIKPTSYSGKSKHISDAKNINYKKNLKYKEEKKADVLYVFSDMRGNIKNQKEVLNFISLCISNKGEKEKVNGESQGG